MAFSGKLRDALFNGKIFDTAIEAECASNAGRGTV